MKRLWELFRSRLALRIYLVGLAQIAVVAISFRVIMESNRPIRSPEERAARLREASADLALALADREALQDELLRLERDLRAPIALVDAGGRILATTGSAPIGARSRCADDRPGPPREMRCASAPVRLADGSEGRVEVLAPRRHGPPHAGPPPPPPFVEFIVPLALVVVGVSSLLLARSLTRPLRKLSSAARAFGGGDLAARTALDRGDELGDVSRAFDDMAERVTELRRAEKELLADVSHELRTPLARIRVALDIAAEGDAVVARESLADIAGDLEELERLISDILAAARLDLAGGGPTSGGPPLRRRHVDIGELVERAAARFRAAHAGRPLEVGLAGDLPRVDGDPMLLRRVVDNLLENAHKYSDAPADAIDLRARALPALAGSAGRVEIEVVDRGIGIAAADLPRVFRPFFRVDKSRTRATGGLGLGLALAKRIVDAHGGEIELVSAPGAGTTATVRLPAAPAGEGEAEPQQAE